MKTALGRDTRRIKGLFFPSSENFEPRIIVNGNDITKIEVYEEYGPGDFYPWFAVYNGDEITQRVNAVYVESVIYFEDDAQ